MLIARLIADNDDWETRLNQMRATLEQSLVGSTVDRALQSVERLPLSEPVLELQFDLDQPDAVYGFIEVHFGPCDTLLASAPITVPQLFVSDMDSTMIGQECIDELADYAGIKDRIAEITERAMQGELDFQSALTERVALLGGLDEGAIAQCLAARITPTPGAKVLSETLKAHGCRNVLVTGGFHHFADPVAEMLGFDRVVGNRLAVEGGKLTGTLDGPISDASTKLAVLQEEAALLGEGAGVLASGDGANDIPMIEAATYGFAYRAKPKARSAANGRIDRGDLTAILSLLGISRKDWAGV
ncbi:phosphoserine phosphatase SerB [Erythrobacter sp. Dej080120_24]|nr:phosphoserine phosphatase SerB [Erythrobacter sp. Dej080120_24]